MPLLVPVRVRGLIVDDRHKSPVVILQEEDGDRVLPIWIGESEARAIGSVLAQEDLERPMTHDLLSSAIKALKANTVSVAITSISNNTFFAEITLHCGSEVVVLDARPSDSIALALREKCPILVAEEVLVSGGGAGMPAPVKETKEERLKRFLENLDPKDFGKFGL